MHTPLCSRKNTPFGGTLNLPAKIIINNIGCAVLVLTKIDYGDQRTTHLCNRLFICTLVECMHRSQLRNIFCSNVCFSFFFDRVGGDFKLTE